MEKQFKLGDKVYINPKGGYSGQGKDSDGNYIEGEVMKDDLGTGDYYYEVRWSASQKNAYRDKDLILSQSVTYEIY